MVDPDAIDDRIRRAWADLSPDDGVHPTLPLTAWDRVARAVTETDTGPGAARSPGPEARPSPRPARERPTRPSSGRFLAAAAAAVVVVLVGALVTRGLARTEDPTVTARAVLSSDGLAGAEPARGRARLVEADGRLVLDVSAPDVRAEEGAVLEVWLLDPAGGVQSLGLIEDRVRLPVPATIDIDRFSVVDISVEALDGDPAHSAGSVLRGPLTRT